MCVCVCVGRRVVGHINGRLRVTGSSSAASTGMYSSIELTHAQFVRDLSAPVEKDTLINCCHVPPGGKLVPFFFSFSFSFKRCSRWSRRDVSSFAGRLLFCNSASVFSLLSSLFSFFRTRPIRKQGSRFAVSSVLLFLTHLTSLALEFLARDRPLLTPPFRLDWSSTNGPLSTTLLYVPLYRIVRIIYSDVNLCVVILSSRREFTEIHPILRLCLAEKAPM